MFVIIPENEENNKIVFDFCDQIAPAEIGSLKNSLKQHLFDKAKELNRSLTDEEERAVKKYFEEKILWPTIEKYTLTVRKDCLIPGLEKLTNAQLADAIDSKVISRILLSNSGYLNINSDKIKNFESALRENDLQVCILPKNGSVEIELPLWRSSSQSTRYNEVYVYDSITNKFDPSIEGEYLGAGRVKILQKHHTESERTR